MTLPENTKWKQEKRNYNTDNQSEPKVSHKVFAFYEKY